jgi:hypothetical protein
MTCLNLVRKGKNRRRLQQDGRNRHQFPMDSLIQQVKKLLEDSDSEITVVDPDALKPEQTEVRPEDPDGDLPDEMAIA